MMMINVDQKTSTSRIAIWYEESAYGKNLQAVALLEREN